MTILCGTDFSQEAASAMRVAAQLAARLNMPLHLAHAVALGAVDHVDSDTRAQLARAHRQRLEAQAEPLRTPGLQIHFHVGEGAPDELMLSIATDIAASLIIVSALGRRKRSQWQLGSHADRLAQRSHVPVLVVRDEDALGAWARNERPMRVVLGADLGASTEAAMHWIDDLARFGRCDVVAVNLYWPPEQFARLGLSGVRNYIQPVPDVTDALERQIKAQLAHYVTCNLTRVRSEPHLGRVGDRLAAIAKEEQADLIVVGSRDHGIARVWEGSVSRTVLQQAEVSVACIPLGKPLNESELPHRRSVLVATDFSPTGNAAIPLAYAAAERGAVIHVVHVVPVPPASGSLTPRDIFPPSHSPRNEHRDILERLAHLVPKLAAAREQRTELHVLESNQPAEAVCQAGERLDVDLICLGTHGRSGLARVLLGSVANGVLSDSHRPVLLARPSH